MSGVTGTVVTFQRRRVLELDCGIVTDRQSEIFGETIYFLNLREPGGGDCIVWSGFEFDSAMQAAKNWQDGSPDQPFLRILCDDPDGDVA